jgi:hypothetical protein
MVRRSQKITVGRHVYQDGAHTVIFYRRITTVMNYVVGVTTGLSKYHMRNESWKIRVKVLGQH